MTTTISAPTSSLLRQALASQQRGDVKLAAELYGYLLDAEPDQPDALHFLGVLDYQNGQLQRGRERVEAAVRARPDNADFLGNLGTIYLSLNRTPDALRVYTRAVELAPNNLSHLCNLGVALSRAGQCDEAIGVARKVLAKKPGYAAALNVIGNAARQKGDFATAKDAFGQNMKNNPQDPEAWYNYGVVLQDLWDMAGARDAYDKAIALKPDVARYYVNHGAALMKLHDVAGAGRSYAKALALQSDLAEAHYNYAICQLLQGNIGEGAKHYDWRLKVDETSLSKPRAMSVPMWDGAIAKDKTVLLHSEQGLGDMLQFIRLAPAVAAMVGKVVVEVQKPLVPLLSYAFPDITIIAKGDEVPAHDLHCPLMSLMHALKLQLDDLPASMIPYLKADPARVAYWKDKLGNKPGRLVAINWQGNPKAKVDRGRSIALKLLAPVLSIPGIRFISLQKNDGAEQLDQLPPELRARIETLGDEYDSGPGAFIDTAAVMACCDLVLTTDTAIAHVAGALGRPTYLMLKKTPDWRWLLERTDSPWYPSMRLFRQREEDNWQQVVAQVALALQPAMTGLQAALAAHQAGQLDVAEEAYKSILTQNPDEPMARHHLGIIALQRGQGDVAETHIRQALLLQPDNADALANLALALKAQSRFDEAVDVCQLVLQLQPQHAAAHNNLGNIYKAMGAGDKAIAQYRQAIALNPGHADNLHNLGLALIEAGELMEAEAPLRQAVKQAPDRAEYHFDLARCLLMRGHTAQDWASGWQEYEWRRKMGEFGQYSEPNGPRWQGQVDKRIRLLIHAEQGLGDALQFIRFVAPVRARVGHVILVVPPQLKAILAKAPGVDEVCGYGEALPPAHMHIPLLSLPALLGITPDNVGVRGAYLPVSPAHLGRWQAWRARHPGRLVGLNWQGNPKARADVGRSLKLAQLAAFAKLQGVTFVALQKGQALEQLADLPEGFPLLVPPAPFDDGPDAFLDTAALMTQLDLVITTDTSIAHLAGALGRPCWVMLKQTPDWRWMQARTDSPWYPFTRLFRQPQAGDWDSVIANVTSALQSWLQPAQSPQLEAALALHRQGQLAPSAQAYEAVLQQDPRNLVARHYLGVVLHQQGKSAQGEPLVQAVVAEKPDYAEAWGNLALIYKVQHKIDAAIEAFEQALKFDPANTDVRNNYGNLLTGIGAHDKAVVQFERAISLQPNRPDSYQNLGNAYADCEREDDAIRMYKRALALKPDYVHAMNGLGKVYRKQNDINAAIGIFREAIMADPRNADSWSNLGVCYREQARYREALEAYDEAIKWRPDHAECWSNRAIALHYSGQFDAAEEAYRRSLALKNDRADAHFGLAAVLLTQGKWTEGWSEYEWRSQMKESGPPRRYAQPQWQGETAKDKTLLLYVEQGLGDTLQFIRFLPLVAQKVGQIVLEVQPGLRRLLKGAVGDAHMVGQGDALPPFDLYASVMSLPALLGLALSDLPAPAHYITPEADLVEQWRLRLPQGKLRVGLNWQGNPKAAVDKGRSVPLRFLQPVLERDDITFISLQKNAGVEQLEQLAPELRARIHTLGDDFDAGKDAFIDTAAVMANLDLIITSDTAMAHLAGALGRPCWVMLKYMPDWRWLFGRDDCPWYPSTHLFRQQVEGDWAGVTSRISDALYELTHAK